MTDLAETYTAIRDEVQTILIGKETLVERLTISLLTGGHVLLEGVPALRRRCYEVVCRRDGSRYLSDPNDTGPPAGRHHRHACLP